MNPKERPSEQEAVRTTIVGGRPPGSGKTVGPIPRGVEVLVKKAAIDPAFKQTLIEKRAKAADEIGLKLEPAEAAMLSAVPANQLETIIANTNVSEVSRAAFLGRAAAVMLAALGAVATQGCNAPTTKGIAPDRIPTKGEEPDRPPKKEDASKDLPPAAARSPGIRPDVPEPPAPPQRPREVMPTDGIRPDRPDSKEDERPSEPPVTQGIRPDK